MNSILPPSIELHHLQTIVRAMYAVAQTDGVHDAEKVMLRGFYEACQEESSALATYDNLIATPFDANRDVAAFDTPERKGTLLHSCILLAHADGHYSGGERAKITEIAKAMSVTSDELTAIEDGIADHLLQQISRISNTDALREVAAEIAAK